MNPKPIREGASYLEERPLLGSVLFAGAFLLLLTLGLLAFLSPPRSTFRTPGFLPQLVAFLVGEALFAWGAVSCFLSWHRERQSGRR